MPTKPRRLWRAAPVALVVGALALTVAGLSPAQAHPEKHAGGSAVPWRTPADADASPASAQAAPTHASAETALSRAESLLSPTGVSARLAAARTAETDPAAPAPARDASMVLRDLVVARSQLTGSDRAAANRLLARPAASKVYCNAQICVHWQTSGDDAPSLKDSNHNGIPDYVETVARTVSHVQQTYVGAGYRKPESDHGRGGNDKPDIYLSNLGPQGLYGYCTTDASTIPRTGPHDTWAYCVLDNDYSHAEFPSNTPLQNLEVTAAHEYFHAVQFAYDILEDQWFMEATATWAEDEVYTKVNDNVQYLADSPITEPGHAMDKGGGISVYGDWIFFRYLTEHLTASKGGLPTLVRDFWRKADSSKVATTGHDYYSLQAITKVLAARGMPLATAFGKFAAANLHTATAYREGRANHYPNSPLWGAVILDASHHRTTVGKPKLDHLTSATAQFTPGAGTASRKWHLKLIINLANRNTGSVAVVTVYPTGGGKPHSHVITLNKSGGATARVSFSSAKVARVDLTVANASNRFVCHQGKAFSCGGKSRDDNVIEKLQGIISKG